MRESIEDIVVIEGFGGAGKTTAAQNLATYYGYSNFNTGTLFRASAAATLLEGVAAPDLGNYIGEARFRLDLSEPTQPLISVNGRDVSTLLQTPEVTSLASYLGSIDDVSKHVEKLFDESLHGAKIVVEGKNLADRITAGPNQHFFLVASQRVRAYRKWQQALQKGKPSYTLEKAQYDTAINDMRDKKLLIIQPNVHVIDTSKLTPMQVVQAIQHHMNNAIVFT